MRQAGILAAAGLYALQHNVARLHEDHQKARQVEQVLRNLSWVEHILPVETNIVIFKPAEEAMVKSLLLQLDKHQIKAVSMGRQMIRFVFHLDQSASDVDRLCTVLKAAHV